jgi:AcrR family transcriptional regulator
MTKSLGLRERKKIRTRRAISEAAIALFMENGFDNVSVAEVAAAAEVSKMTVFNYFPAKEDLVLERVDDHIDEASEVVAAREPGETPVGALRRHFLAALREHSVNSGLNDTPGYLTFQRMVMDTPSLRLRLTEQGVRAQDSLTAAFAQAIGADPGDLLPRVAAVQVLATLQVLVVRNLTQVLEGASAAEALPSSIEAAERAFELLERGLGGSGLAD